MSFAGDLRQNLTLAGFTTASFNIGGNFSGQLDASALGTASTPIQQVQVAGSITATALLKASYLGSLSVTGDLAGVVKGFGNSGNQTLPTIGTVTIGGNLTNTGSITAPILGTVTVNDLAGLVSETNPSADMQTLSIRGSLTSTGQVNAASIGSMTVGKDLAGQVHVTGLLGSLNVTSNDSGIVAAGSMNNLIVGKAFTGQLQVPGGIGDVTVGSAGVTVLGNILDIVGGLGSADQIQISPTGSSNTGSTGIKVKGTLNGASISKTYTQAFASLYFHGYGGNLNFAETNSLAINTHIVAGNGNDTLQLGDGVNTVTLGDGNDVVQAGNGINNLTLGNGNDSLKLGDGPIPSKPATATIRSNWATAPIRCC